MTESPDTPEEEKSDATDHTVDRRTVLGGIAAGAAVGAVAGAAGSHALTGAHRPGMEALKQFEGEFEGSMKEYDEDGNVLDIPMAETVSFIAGGTAMRVAKKSATAIGLNAQEYNTIITYDAATDSYEMSVTGPNEAFTQVGVLTDEGDLVFTGKNPIDGVSARRINVEPGTVLATRSVMSADPDGVDFSYHLRVDDSWKEVFAKRSTRLKAERVSDL